MALLSKKDAKLITDPLTDNNPITIQVLGICSALAITAELNASIVMAVSVLFVLGVGNVVISLMRNIIPSKIRIIVQLIVVATLVIIVDLVLKAFAYELSKTLGAFIGLIITNCIIMGRFEAFALGNGPWKSFLDGIGNAVGYGVILIIVGFFRELLGAGTLLGFKVLGDPIEKTGLYAIGYENNGFMLLAPMALIVVGILIWVQRSRNKALIEEKVRNVTFKGAAWDIEFEPTIAGILRLKKQAQANSEELNFTTKTDNGDLKIFFGDPSTHSGNFVFQPGVTGTLSRTWQWPVKVFLSIMDLPGDKTVRISDQGAAQITVDSGYTVYEYLLPAQAK